MTVRVGICSVAHLHADSYAAGLDELVGVTEDGDVAVDGDDVEKAKARADAYGTSFSDPDDLLDAVDAVIVCSTNAAHREWVERAADAGVDVLCEKPLAPSLDDARAMVDACDEAGVHLGVAMPLRFSQPVRNAKVALETDALGDVRFLSGTNRGQMPGGWFVDADRSGGGAVTDHSVHIVDVARWITGENVAEVYAESDTRFHDIPVEDVNLLSMELTDGTQFVLDGSWSKPEKWDTWGDATLRVVGTDGVVAVDCFDQTIKQTRDSEDAGIHSIYWGSDPDQGLIRDFVEAVADDRPPLKTGRDALAEVALVEAAYESVETGLPVDVEPTPEAKAEEPQAERTA